MDDKEIIKLFQQRSEAAIDRFKEKYDNYCFLIAQRILNDQQEALQCLNDTYVRLWNSIPPALPVSLKSYSAAIIRNLAIDSYNRKQRSVVETPLKELEGVLSDRNSPEDEVRYNLLVEELNRFLARQSRKERVVFVKRYFHFLSVKEIAEETGLSVTNVTTILGRVRQRLKEHLVKEGYDL